MNKHNIVELHDYKQNKINTNMEQNCYAILDKAVEKIDEMKVYVKNFHRYIDNMVEYNYINKSFAHNLRCQIDLIVETAVKQIAEVNNR